MNAEKSGAKKTEISGGLAKSSVGIELALSAVLFGLIGFWLDAKIGTKPVLFIGFFIFGFLGSAFSAYYRFKEQMRVNSSPKDAES